ALRSDFRGYSGDVLPHEAQVGGAPEVIRLDLREECQRRGDGLRALREGLALQRTATSVKLGALAEACAAL
ncbi:MAG TPA: hypothetical protein VJR89_24155, partial [Polyangiales bacterium]|nr:hypothetical protein [Polyangiales bacterium]